MWSHVGGVVPWFNSWTGKRMSVEAPWLALACDWHESAMFDGTTAGQKLAFIAMLCFSKSRGRAGRFTLRASVMCHDFTISEDDLSQMLTIAKEHGAITVDGSVVQFTNWAIYQDPAKRRANLVKRNGFSKSSTTGPGPRTRTRDQDKKRSADACSEPAQTPDAAPPSLTRMEFPVRRRNIREPKTWHLTEAKLVEYQEAFDNLDVLVQLRAALQWVRDNPTKRKTARGMPRFLGAWLARTSDSGRARPRGQTDDVADLQRAFGGAADKVLGDDTNAKGGE